MRVARKTRRGMRRQRAGLHDPQAMRFFQVEFCFVTCAAEEYINGAARVAQDACDLARVVTVEKPQNQNRCSPRRFFSDAGVKTDAAQLGLHLDLIAHVDRSQAKFAGVVIDYGKLLDAAVNRATDLRQMKVAS